MSNHRINIIAALSAIALLAVPSLMAQTSAATDQSRQPTATSSSPTTSSNTDQSSSSEARQSGDQSTSPAATSPAYPTATEPANSSQAASSPALSDSGSQAPTTSITSATTSAADVGSSLRAEIKRADDTVEQSSAAKLKGQRVRDSNANELGKINDFIIDGGTGKIAHVVISTGGVLGVGDKLRLIPGTKLKQSAGNEFTSDMAQADFEALPTISEKDLKAGRITAQPSASSQTGDVAAMQATGPVVRASQLKDKSIRSDDHQVGEIEHVIIDLQNGEAMALIETNSGFAGESGKFLVPFSKLEVRSAESEHIGSSLLRSDFASLQTSETTASTTSQSASAAPSATTAPGASSTDIADSNTLSTSAAGVSRASNTTTAPSSTSSSSDFATTSTPSSSSSTLATDTSSTSTDASTSVGQSIDPTSSRSGAAPTEDRGDRSRSSSSTVASAAGTTSTDAAVTGDTTRSPGLADTANAPSDPSNTSPSVVTSAPSRGPGDEQLAPTGLTSADQSPASGATAMAIRQALDSDATLAREDVQVTTKIVLHGSVKSEEAKSRIEELAKKAANNAEIDNQITVQPK